MLKVDNQEIILQVHLVVAVVQIQEEQEMLILAVVVVGLQEPITL
tara:strand:+ start:484 stop:618 length:135 start_codon:yes stop_codon:yes gene_type:complete